MLLLYHKSKGRVWVEAIEGGRGLLTAAQLILSQIVAKKYAVLLS